MGWPHPQIKQEVTKMFELKDTIMKDFTDWEEGMITDDELLVRLITLVMNEDMKG
jgi:hypothetical protein